MTDAQITEGDNTLKAATADLKSFAERIARLEDEKAVLTEDIKDVYAEAKARGYDTKALRAVLSLQKKDEATRAAIHLYGERMGIFA